jgi:hypothetical protein
MTAHPFDPLRALQVLTEHRVRFVVIGGIAGRLWGSPTVTNHLDLCHDTTPDNLAALAAALQALDARLRGVDDEIPWWPDADALAAADPFTLATSAGNLDLLARPAGSGGYDDLAASAVALDVGGLVIAVTALEDLLRMKRAAGRPKDLIEAEVLGAVLEERDARPADQPPGGATGA